MAKNSLAERLYRGEADLDIVGRRKLWFIIAAALVVISIGSFSFNSFHLGIEFAGGTSYELPATVQGKELSQAEVSDAVERAIKSVDPEGEIGAAQKVGTG